MKKVLHLISTSVFSGAENVACQIINSFADNKNYEMIYAAVIGQNKKSLDDRNIKYFNLEKFDLKHIKKIIKKYNPDIIHAHDIRATILAVHFSKKIKVISHIHGNHENMRSFNLKTFLYNLASKKVCKIIWVSQSAYNNYYYKKNVKNKSIVLYNVINPTEIKNKSKLDNNKYNYDLLFLGRLTYPKNPERLIEILKEATESYKDLKVAIVGDGELKNNIEELIKKYHLEKNIDVLGFVSNPYKILLDSKILILTSRYEGTPMVALEAIALNKPIISTPTDGLKEIIIDGETGFLSADDKIIVNKILELLENKKLYNEMSKNVESNNLKINNIEKYKNKIVDIYNS